MGVVLCGVVFDSYWTGVCISILAIVIPSRVGVLYLVRKAATTCFGSLRGLQWVFCFSPFNIESAAREPREAELSGAGDPVPPLLGSGT